jgi:hypothetical protein
VFARRVAVLFAKELCFAEYNILTCKYEEDEELAAQECSNDEPACEILKPHDLRDV